MSWILTTVAAMWLAGPPPSPPGLGLERVLEPVLEPAALSRGDAGSSGVESVDRGDSMQAAWPSSTEIAQLVVPAWQRYWRGDETELLDHPRWIRHRVGPRETLAQIAARYGTEVHRLKDWNPKTLARKRRYLKVGALLRLRATRVPPQREPVALTATAGQTWEAIAVDYRVDVRDLKAYNDAAREDSMAEVGGQRALTVWVDPAVAWTVGRFPGPEVEPTWVASVSIGALSKGHPNKGRIVGEPCQLPDISALYTRRFDRIAHGSSHAIRTIVGAFASFRRDSGYAGEVLVGSIAQPRGRRFPPHRSHQSGRDVDIRLPKLPWFDRGIEPPPEEIDWRATWALIEAFLATGEVEMIFLDHYLQRPLYYAALSMGASPEQLDEIITWPRRGTDKGKKLIRHASGHEGHIHVRMKCGVDEPDCRTRMRRRARAQP